MPTTRVPDGGRGYAVSKFWSVVGVLAVAASIYVFVDAWRTGDVLSAWDFFLYGSILARRAVESAVTELWKHWLASEPY